MSTPEAFSNQGLQILTQWAQLTEQLATYAGVFEARGGANQFTNAKIVAGEGETLTARQVAANAELDEESAAALDVVTHFNQLRDWYDAGRQARVALRRTDF